MKLGHSSFINSVAFSPDGRLIASGSYDKTIKLWDVNTGEEIRTLKGHSGWVTSVTRDSKAPDSARFSDSGEIKSIV